MDLICIDDKFNDEYLKFYSRFKIETPVKDSIYRIREITKHSNGEYGILLVEIVNSKVPVKNVGIVMFLEPSWATRRFTTLDGRELTLEMLKEEYRLQKSSKVHLDILSN